MSAGRPVEPGVTGQEDRPEELYFEKHVRPILKTHCFQCHGEEPELAGELDVRLVRLLLDGGESGPAIVAGREAESLLLDRIEADEMPPGATKLGDHDKRVIRDWVRGGAVTARPEPEHPDQVKFTEEELSHWAFQPVRAPIPPGTTIAAPLAGENQQLTQLDTFVADRLRTAGLDFSVAADRRTLIRRLTFDLHGLPPTPRDVAAFLADDKPNAYERLVDRLLASPRYGVRWARHWLDVVGYAESDGNLMRDQPRPHAWHYRDYVINAFNHDKPYDEFVVEQLAGDELIAGTPDGNNPQHVSLLAATGMLRMAPDVTQTDDSLLDRNQAVADMIDVVGTSILGLTVGCAQCHDHRYDPIAIEDYYRLRAVFDPAFPLQQWRKPQQRLVDLTDDATRERAAEIEARAVALQADITRRRREHCQTIQDREIEKVPAELRDAVRTAVQTKPAEQTAEQKALLDQFPKVRTIDWIVGQLIEYDTPAYRGFQEEEKQVAEIRKTKPLQRLIMAVQESGETIPESRVFFRGSPESPTEVVQPGELTVLVSQRDHDQISTSELPNRQAAPALLTTGRRLAYAQQLTDGTHPTVARVMVNRIWMHHFGRGLVATPGDFGLNGELPSHPRLLDWLASEFVASGWSIKRLQKQILMSRTYQQASATQASDSMGDDPDNTLLSHMNLRRLDAESVRDAILLISGQLNDQMDGPSVPVAEDGEGKAVIGNRLLRDGLFAGIEEVGGQAKRRSIYISNQRSMPLNILQTFDLPEMKPNCQRRDASTVAPQALLFMNDPFIVATTEAMAEQLWGQASSVTARVEAAFEACFATPPTRHELADCEVFLEKQADVLRADATPAWQAKLKENPAAAEIRALASLCQVFISSNRFLYIQ
ncbi:PSD1 and planctomycete cytochrome C domain-containing protein [Planctomycetaceae bacterium SH139]